MRRGRSSSKWSGAQPEQQPSWKTTSAATGVARHQAKSREKAPARSSSTSRTGAELRLHLTAGLRSGTEVLRIERLAKAYADKQLFQSLDLVVQRGERVGVVGPNGSGKTTLLKILVGQAQADSGYFAFGHNVEPGYFAQDLSGAQPENTLLDEILDAGAATYEEARSLLARFLFFGDDVFKRVGIQRRRDQPSGAGPHLPLPRQPALAR